jgi:hypothetical protein
VPEDVTKVTPTGAELSGASSLLWQKALTTKDTKVHEGDPTLDGTTFDLLRPEAGSGAAFPAFASPRLRKQLHRIPQLPAESVDTAPSKFGMGLAYCPGAVNKRELKAHLPHLDPGFF